MSSDYPEARFGGYSRVDGTVAFFQRVHAVLKSDWVVLDVGCGRGLAAEDPNPIHRKLQILRGQCKKVIGIDVDQVGTENPCIDEFRLINGPSWPVSNVDMIISDSVLEHVPDPRAFFREARRVLSPGGYICIRTTNSWGYPAIAARLIPDRFHARLLRRIRDEEDTFPTLYRCNSIVRIRRLMKIEQFACAAWGHAAEPGYLEFSQALYRIGILYHKLAPHWLAPTLFAFGRKTATV